MGWGLAGPACRSVREARTADRPPAARPAAADPPAIVPFAAVRDLGVQFADNPVGITGLDGATSIVLPNGTALWTFGDTLDFPFASIRQHDLTDVLSNTDAIVPRQDASEGI